MPIESVERAARLLTIEPREPSDLARLAETMASIERAARLLTIEPDCEYWTGVPQIGDTPVATLGGLAEADAVDVSPICGTGT